MPWTRPTRAQLLAAIQADLASALPAPVVFLSRSVLRGVAGITAGAADIVYGILDYAVRQAFATTADAAYVATHAEDLGLTPLAATASAGSVTVVGIAGTYGPSAFTRADGWRYLSDSTFTIPDLGGGGGSVAVPLTAVDLGADGDMDSGTALQFTTPIVDVDSEALAAGAFVGGTDAETAEELRARVLLRKRRPPQGGAEADYVQWALAAGAVKAWVRSPWPSLGSLGVYFVVDGTGSGIIPGSGPVAVVQAALEGEDVEGRATRRPVTATATATAPTAVTVTPTIALTPDTAATRAAVTAELEALMLRRAGESIPISDLWIAIGSATGVTSFVLTTPSAEVPIAAGECAVLGTVTWT